MFKGVTHVPVFKTFAKRKKEAENAGKPVTYRYDYLPKEFVVQVILLWRDVLGAFPDHNRPSVADHWNWVNNTLCREMGLFKLVPSVSWQSRMEDCAEFLLQNEDVDLALSLIELSFFRIDTELRRQLIDTHLGHAVKLDIDDVLKELNYRFREHSIGYQYEEGQLVSVNSQYLHSEAVEPALNLLRDTGFEGALEEFMNAHGHYRERNYKEAIVNSSNAFESTMRTICDIRGWAYPQNATSSKLIDILFDNDLVTTEMKSHFTSLRSTLASGVPAIRNKGGQGGHGQGSAPIEVPDHIAAYALHLTASNIVFLVESHKALNK